MEELAMLVVMVSSELLTMYHYTK